MGLYKKAHVRGINFELVRRGVITWPNEKIAEEAAEDDEAAEDVIDDDAAEAEEGEEKGDDEVEDDDRVEITEFIITVDDVDDAIAELGELGVEAETVTDELGGDEFEAPVEELYVVLG